MTGIVTKKATDSVNDLIKNLTNAINEEFQAKVTKEEIKQAITNYNQSNINSGPGIQNNTQSGNINTHIINNYYSNSQVKNVDFDRSYAKENKNIKKDTS